jgi:hypothetical protein
MISSHHPGSETSRGRAGEHENLARHPRPPRHVNGRRRRVRAYLVLTERGPILVLSSFADLGDPASTEMLARKGIVKFIAYNLPLRRVEECYGVTFEVIAMELANQEAVRVLDFDGRRIFASFSISRLGDPLCYETSVA